MEAFTSELENLDTSVYTSYRRCMKDMHRLLLSIVSIYDARDPRQAQVSAAWRSLVIQQESATRGVGGAVGGGGADEDDDDDDDDDDREDDQDHEDGNSQSLVQFKSVSDVLQLTSALRWLLMAVRGYHWSTMLASRAVVSAARDRLPGAGAATASV